MYPDQRVGARVESTASALPRDCRERTQPIASAHFPPRAGEAVTVESATLKRGNDPACMERYKRRRDSLASQYRCTLAVSLTVDNQLDLALDPSPDADRMRDQLFLRCPNQL